ncbi:hypothetical protein BH11MYX2_BH11MYX2_08690 [soil metagenome]
MGADTTTTDDPTVKASAYAQSVRAVLEDPAGKTLEVVWRTATPDDMGHDRRADRAAEMLLAYEDFKNVPNHVTPLDIGALTRDGLLVSLRDYNELYLVTEYANGAPYAQELREIALRGRATEHDHQRVTALATYLAKLHVPIDTPGRYRRSIRDLVGSGEGIFGVADNFPSEVPGASLERIEAIERRCATWRWKLRDHDGRLCRIHGDFHPFNILFDADRLVLLEASRGTAGDPADDLCAMSINFMLFALDSERGWAGLGPLWHRFWDTYSQLRPDPSLRRVAPPFFAWRALVLSNPRFYPNLSGPARSSLLGVVEGALDAGFLDLAWADEVFQ